MCTPTYFLHFDVLIVRCFLTLCLGTVMGCFVRLLRTACFLERTSILEGEVEENEGEEE